MSTGGYGKGDKTGIAGIYISGKRPKLEGEDSSKIITNFTFGSNYYGRYLKEEDIFQTIITHHPNLYNNQ